MSKKTKSLTSNTSKSGGVLNSSRQTPKHPLPKDFSKSFERKLQLRSPWYQSIMDPISGAGARIPDPQGFNTATFQYVQDTTVAVNANGIAGLRVISPYSRADSGTLAHQGGNYAITDTNASLAGVKFGDGTTNLGYSLCFDALNNALGGAPSSATTSLATRMRVVSGAIYAFYEGTSLSNAGDFITYTNFGGIQSNDDPVQNFANLYGASVLPVNSGKAVVARWMPYRSATGSNGVVNAYSLGYDDFVNANGTFTSPSLVREMGVILRGGTASTGSVRFRIVFNYEWVPRANTGTFIIASPSPVDPAEEAFCVRQLADGQNATAAVNPTILAKVPNSSKVTEATNKELTGPLAGLSSAAGFIGDILEVALPLLTMIL